MITPRVAPADLVTGIVGKLNFDFTCQRGHGFNETYLYGAIVEILASCYTKEHDIRTGYGEPSIQDPKKTSPRGRQRELDFGVFDRNAKHLELALEAKWVGSSHATPKNIFQDICRLGAVSKSHPDVNCWFVLAGESRRMRSLMNKKSMKQYADLRILPYPYDQKEKKVRLFTNGSQDSQLSSKEQVWAKNSFQNPPSQLTVTQYDVPITDGRWSALIWKVRASS